MAPPNSNIRSSVSQDLIDINQDDLGVAAGIFQPPDASEPVPGEIYPYWAGQLSDGVVLAFAAATAGGMFEVDFGNVPGLEAGSYSWKEAYSGEEGSGERISFEVATNDIAVFKVIPA